jgi:hypothetical protein
MASVMGCLLGEREINDESVRNFSVNHIFQNFNTLNPIFTAKIGTVSFCCSFELGGTVAVTNHLSIYILSIQA